MAADTAPTLQVSIRGAIELQRALGVAPAAIRRRMVKAMRLAARPAQARAAGAVHWSAPVTIRATRTGAKVGSAKLVPPIIEFGNKAVVGPGGKVAPHVRKLHKQPALIDAVEGTAELAAVIARQQLDVVLDEVLTAFGALR